MKKDTTSTTSGDSTLNPVITNKYDFVVVFSIKNGNPNGDPDADNRPRVNDKTNLGLVSPECLKFKVRKYVQTTREGQEGYDIFGRTETIANDVFEDESKKVKSKELKDVRPSLCKRFFDMRTFGGVLSTGMFKGDSNGQLRGPVQFGMSTSIDPLDIQHLTITRCYVTDKKDSEKERTMGGRYFTPFGLYRFEGSVSVPAAKKTGFSQDDLNLLFESIQNMFENDNSTSRFGMGVEKLVVFKHNSEFGSFPQHKLHQSVTITKKNGVTNPTSFNDYVFTVNETVKQQIVGKVEVMELV